MIVLKNVNKYYNKGKQNEIHVINDVSLNFPNNGIVALYGKSGCGKTTILNVIGGLATVESGAVTVAEKKIDVNTDYIRNQYIGYIFQNYYLNENETVYDNVANVLKIAGLNDSYEMDSRVMAVLKSVKMDKYANRHPHTLSGGQQQRVAIARAIVKKPSIILADEPTGNLDKKNTILVMEILKELSKEHLIILVTHEKELVNCYCDMIIEIADGSVIDIRNNEKNAYGKIRNTNTIYLGELEKRECVAEFSRISYYGDLPDKLINIDIVYNNGQTYIKVSGEHVQYLSDNSEVMISEGVFEENEKEEVETTCEKIEIVKLPEIEQRKKGRLFNWKNSLKYGWKNIVGDKSNSRHLRMCLTLLSVILVLLTSYYGTSIKDIIDAAKANNSNSFYAYVPDSNKANELIGALDSEETGIDELQFSRQLILGDQNFYIQIPQVQNCFNDLWDEISVIPFHGTLFSTELSDELELVCGTKGDLNDDKVIITTAVADDIIGNSKLGFINQYESLLGLNAVIDRQQPPYKISGIVKSEERVVYLENRVLAKSRYEESCSALITTGENYNSSVEQGKVILRINEEEIVKMPDVGDKVVVNGNELIISKVINVKYPYEEWLRENKIEKKTDEESMLSEYEYLDYYYAEYDNYVQYCRDNKAVVEYSPYMELIEKGCKEAWYISVMELSGNHNYYNASVYKNVYGKYPNETDIEDTLYMYEDPYAVVSTLLNGNELTPECVYILNEEDYINCSMGMGKYMGYGITDEDDDNESYVVIHSYNPIVTEKYLKEIYTDVTVSTGRISPYTTPEMLHDEKIEKIRSKLMVSFVIWGVFATILCICIYIIMRGNMIRKMREIGIYRCIGVSKKNIIFRFFVESAVLVGATVVIGHLITSVVLWMLCDNYSYIMNGVIFYPYSLGVALLVLISVIAIIFGMLPVVLLLRKSPSEIIVKYDL